MVAVVAPAVRLAVVGTAVMSAVAVVAWWEPVQAGPIGGWGLWVDRAGSPVVVLIAGVGAVVASFARRSLRGEAYRARFLTVAGLLTTASLVVATSSNLTGLVLGWVAASACVPVLIGLTGTVEARSAARRARTVLAVGDLALVAAAVTTWVVWGTIDLRGPAAPFDGVTAAVVGGLVLVAAASRSAQVPAHRWLIGTVWAPTPVSALLHAGVVNGGGILMLRLWGLVGASAVVLVGALALGTVTLVVGTLRARSRGDVKGALAESTVAQMGFMTITCALGAHVATLLHLVAHGWFKAALFLGSGSAVATSRRARQHPAPHPRPAAAWAAVAVVVPVAAVGAVALTAGPVREPGSSAGELLVAACVAAAAVAVAQAGVRHGRRPSARASAVVLSGVVAAGYLFAVHRVGGALESSLPILGDAVPSAWWLVPVALAVLGAAAVVRGIGGQRLHQVTTPLYAAVAIPPLTVGPVDPAARPAGRKRSADLRDRLVPPTDVEPVGAP